MSNRGSKYCEPMEGARIERRLEKQRQRACFWSWPLGHCFHWKLDDALTYWGKCCRCDKRKVNPPPRMLPMLPPPKDW